MTGGLQPLVMPAVASLSILSSKTEPLSSMEVVRARDRRRWVGVYGEWCAAWWLRLRGYRVLQYDYETPYAQIDLLAAERRPWGWSLVLCEVKTRRRSRSRTIPESPIKGDQVRRLWKSALWLQRQCDRRSHSRIGSTAPGMIPSRGKYSSGMERGAALAVRVDLLRVELKGPAFLSFVWVGVRHVRGVVWEENVGDDTVARW